MPLLLLNACDKAAQNTWQESVRNAIKEKRTLTRDDFNLLPMEDYADSKQFDGPRIMFEGAVPWPIEKNSPAETLWSIKPDGTDLRMILTLEEMYGDTRGCCINNNTDLARSRDNRYIAFITGNKQNHPEAPDSRGVWLVDLKTRKFTNVHTSAIRVRFTYDSKKLLYIDGDMYEYDIDSGKERKRNKPLGVTSGFGLCGPQDTMVMHRGTKIHFFTYEGKSIRTIDLKKLLSNWDDIDFSYSSTGSIYSANGRYVVIPFFKKTWRTAGKRNLLVNLSEEPAASLMENSAKIPNDNGIISSEGSYLESRSYSVSTVFPKYGYIHFDFPGEFIPTELTGGHHVLNMDNMILINEPY
jgi:hypothetical protein